MLVVCALLTPGSQARQPARDPAAAAPDWQSWRVFHESLIYYADRSQEQTEDVLSARLDLARGDVRTLVTAGQAYIDAIAAIDADARAEVRERYGLPEANRRSGAGGRWTSATEPEAGSSTRARAIQDGMFARIEARKAAALRDHTRSLARLIDTRGLSRVGWFVQNAVAGEIKAFERGRQMPRAEHQPVAAHGFAQWSGK